MGGISPAFTKPWELFKKVDLSRIEDIGEVMQTQEMNLYRGPEVEEPMEISGIRPVGIPRDTRKAIMDEFGRGGENYIRPTDIKKLYERFHEVDLDGSGEISFDEFLAAMQTPNEHLARRLFNIFDVDGSNTVSLREFVVGLSNFTRADIQETQLFAFQLYDEDNSGTIKENELTNLIAANFAATGQVSDKEIREKVSLVYRSLGLERERPPLDQRMWLDAVRRNPTLVAPVHDFHHRVEADFVHIKDATLGPSK